MKQFLLAAMLSTFFMAGVANASNQSTTNFWSIDGIQADSLYIPSAFSPNGDGRNDLFEVFMKPNTDAVIKNYAIFNRWGSMVFESKNFTLPASDSAWWDGYFNGEKVTPDTYVYRIEIEYTGKRPIIYTGEIAIVN